MRHRKNKKVAKTSTSMAMNTKNLPPTNSFQEYGESIVDAVSREAEESFKKAREDILMSQEDLAKRIGNFLNTVSDTVDEAERVIKGYDDVSDRDHFDKFVIQAQKANENNEMKLDQLMSADSLYDDLNQSFRAAKKKHLKM